MNNLLDSSRVATGALRPELRPVGYDEVAALALRGLDPGVDSGRVRLEIDERLPEVLADPGLLERVVANLVDNALRHGRRRPGRRCAPAATPTTSSCGWSTRARACRPAGPSACSPRSSASATATTTGSGSG